MEDLEKLLATCLDEGLIVYTDDGNLVPSESGQVYASELMGGRDLRNATTSIMRALCKEGTFIEDGNSFQKLPWPTLYFVVLKTIDLVTAKVRSTPIWKEIVTDLENQYLPPEYWDNRSHAFLNIRDDD